MDLHTRNRGCQAGQGDESGVAAARKRGERGRPNSALQGVVRRSGVEVLVAGTSDERVVGGQSVDGFVIDRPGDYRVGSVDVEHGARRWRRWLGHFAFPISVWLT